MNAAVDKITSGALPGQVPGQALINAQVAAEAAVTSYENANKAGIDALVAKLAANATAGTDTDLITSNSTFQAKVDAVVADAADFRTAVSSEADTSVLVTRAATADAKLKASYAALNATEKANADKYVAAIAAEATAKAAQATATEKGAAIGGLDNDATAAAALATHTDAAALYAEYVGATAAERTVIDTEFKDSAFYATFKAAVAKDAAYADAVAATAAAKDVLDTTSGTVTGSTAGDTYVTDLTAKTEADKLVVDAKAADADVAAAKVFADAYNALNEVVTKAGDAIADFNSDNSGVSQITDIGTSTAGTAPVKDVFYFADKAATIDTGADYSLTFGNGDSIVLGNGFTFNNGALTTGDNNKAEFFLVQTDTGTQVVVESKAFGSASVTADASTGVANAADAVTVITLTGVNVADLTVNNGVISHVA